MNVLRFSVEGDFAHFRKPFSNISRLTYLIPPKMTIGGMLAGIMGMERDSYYEKFTTENFLLSVVPEKSLETTTIPQNLQPTAGFNNINSRGGGPSIGLIRSQQSYKRRIFEYVVNPKYTIYVHIEDNMLFEKLYESLNSEEYVYTPNLGIEKCLANISEVQRVTVSDPEESDSCRIRSPVSDLQSVVNVSNKSIQLEKITRSFTIGESNRGLDQRISEEFLKYQFDSHGEGLDVHIDNYDGEGVLKDVGDEVVEFY